MSASDLINNPKYSKLIESSPEFKKILNELEAEHIMTLRNITHEFGNILTLINSSLQIIESSHPEVSEYKYWNSTTNDVHYMISLLSEISTYNNSTKLHLETINITELIHSVSSTYNGLYADKNVTSKFETINYPPEINADKTKIKQVFINLIKNAFESISPDTSGLVHISIDYCDGTISITISDNGCGIPDCDIDKIFLPMVTFKPNGTGLGLPISKRIIEAHNGSISVTSSIDKGTTFRILLPVR